MALSRGRRYEPVNYWPGFVDALSTMLLVIIFLLSVFMLAQFFLSREVTGKDEALTRLNRQIEELTNLLALERTQKSADESQDRDPHRDARFGAARAAAPQGRGGRGRGRRGGRRAGRRRREARSTTRRQISARALAEVDVLNQQIAALRKQLAAIEDALSASETANKESQSKIADLGQRLNVALAQKVQELNRYRSDFFGRLRQILGSRPDIRVVGDRFVFESSVLFDVGKADISPRGQAIARFARRRRPRPRARDPAGYSRGSCGSTATPTASRSPGTASTSRTGSFPPRAPSRWCNIWCRRASSRTGSPPPASASSSRSTREPTKPRSRATAASN